MSASADRRRAVGILLRVEGGAFASRLLASVSAPGVRSRVMAVLRWRRALDEAIDRCLRKPKLDAEIRVILRVALVEITEIGVPAPVAGDAGVRLARQMGKGRAAGLVNAVIRRAPDQWNQLMAAGSQDLCFSHPEWLWKRWKERFGAIKAEESMSWAQRPAKLWVWFLKAPAEIGDLEEHQWLPGAFTAPGTELLPALEAGEAYAMDPSSQLISHLASKVCVSEGRILDLCAAPGGKSARIATFNPALDVVAADLSLKRLALGQALFRRAGLRAAVVADAQRPAFAQNSCDLVILDAPCSGTGTFRRHPELKDRLRPEDIEDRATLQVRLISSAQELVGSGGVLLYSTCSVEAEENEEHFQTMPSGFELMSPAPYLPERLDWIETSSGGCRVLLGEDHDGFSIQLLRRK